MAITRLCSGGFPGRAYRLVTVVSVVVPVSGGVFQGIDAHDLSLLEDRMLLEFITITMYTELF